MAGRHRRPAAARPHGRCRLDDRARRVVGFRQDDTAPDGQPDGRPPQELVDRWLTGESRDAVRVRHFIRWCHTAGINTNLVAPRAPRPDFLLGGTHGSSNEAALTRAATDETLDPRHRLAITLAIVYGIRVHRIAELPIAALQLNDDHVSIRLGTIDLRLPDIARPWIMAIRSGIAVKRRLGGRNADPVWIFPGYRHGDHILPSSLAGQLRGFGVDPPQGIVLQLGPSSRRCHRLSSRECSASVSRPPQPGPGSRAHNRAGRYPASLDDRV